MDMGQPEPATDQTAVAKYLLYLLRCGIGGDIKIFRLPAQEQITDTPSYQIGLIPGIFEPIEYLDGMFTDIGPGDIMLRAGNDMWRNYFIYSLSTSKKCCAQSVQNSGGKKNGNNNLSRNKA